VSTGAPLRRAHGAPGDGPPRTGAPSPLRARRGAALLAAVAVATTAIAPAAAQPAPAAPPAPSAPRAPGAPAAPPAPPGQQATADLSRALLVVSARSGRAEALVVELGGALDVVVSTRRGPGASRGLALALAGALGGRALDSRSSHSLAGGLAGALSSPTPGALESALAEIRTALLAAGVPAAEVPVVLAEVRRAAPGP
jgi:hypothetical protein